MASEKTSRSVRMFVLLFIGVCCALFAILLFTIFYSTMPQMLLQSEQAYLIKQRDVLVGLMKVAERNTYVMADDVGIWDETVRFAEGKNPNYIKNNWPDASLLEGYRFNFILIKDRNGDDLYVEFLDYVKKEALPVPEGFSERIAALARQVGDMYTKALPEDPDIEELGKGGLLFYQGMPYFLACMPIMETRESGNPVGTVTMGHIMNTEYFRNITHLDTASFQYLRPEDESSTEEATITRESDSAVSTALPLKDIDGNAVVLRMADSRPIYQEGRSILYWTGLMLLGALAAFGLTFYFALSRYLVRPVEKLSRDIENNDFSVDVPPDTYSGARELISLCSAISDMLRRLDQSKISMDAMQSILNGLDAYIYVTDPETDELLFMNDLMKEHYGVEGTGTGLLCWKVMGKSEDGRCAFCPKRNLERNNDAVVAWEEENRDTGRYYHNTDRLIQWVGGRKAHLQHKVDITKRKETEAELMRMSAVVTSSPHCIYFFDLEGNFEYFNPSALKTFGFNEEDLAGKNIDAVLDEHTLAYAKEILIPRIVEEGRAEFEIPVLGKDGVTRIMAFSGFLTRYRPRGLGAIASDITEKRLLEKELVAAKELAERSSMAKGEFLSRMSHEMRTPLNAIIGMTSIAKSSNELEKKVYCLQKIEDASNHLLGVINDILDMSKIEANKFELSSEEFVFEKMLMRVVNVVNYRIDEKEQNFIINVDKDVPYALIADEQRLAQVMTNLLANAVKFTPEKGLISLFARKVAEEDDICTLEVEISDTGIGISPEQQAKLFTSFEQADGSISRKFGGTGLGLAISRSIIELMGGEIWVRSEVGQGSTFGFTIQARKGSDGRQHLLSPGVDWESLRVLAVDDAPEVREYFLNLASSVGLSCEVAATGFEAIKRIEENGENPFNIVFADWKMPGMDGIELTRHIKGNFDTKVVVIMISAYEWDVIEKDARAAGVDRFIPKPLFSSVIVDCINACLSPSKWSREEKDSRIGEGAFIGRRILLAEDIEINREIVLSLLQHTGLEIDCAENGADACRMMFDNPDAYDMIFMDIHMPEVDGYEATRRIRAHEHPRARALPIVAMTANVFREDIEKCLACGMDDHIGKPVDLHEIYEKLKRHLGTSPGR